MSSFEKLLCERTMKATKEQCVAEFEVCVPTPRDYCSPSMRNLPIAVLTL